MQQSDNGGVQQSTSNNHRSIDGYTYFDTGIGDHWLGVDMLDYKEVEKQKPALHKMSSEQFI